MKVSEAKDILAGVPTAEQLAELEADTRSGVQKLVAAYHKRQDKLRMEHERFRALLAYERRYYELGAQYIAGIDEAGRGPLAGPLVIAAVILPQDVFISGLNDSKQLSAAKREQIYNEVLSLALAVSVNVVSVGNIDTLNIYQATKLGMTEVLEHLAIKPQVALVDAMPIVSAGIETVSLIHGDALSASIAAASIVAKVTRDRMMMELAEEYPQYGLAGNKGYGSKGHMQAIAEFGATKWHRRSYEPVKSMGLPPVVKEANKLFSPLAEK